MRVRVGRRDLLRASSAMLLSGCGPARGPVEVSGGPRPATWGVQSGDVTQSSAVVWARSDRPARMTVGWAHDATFREETIVEGPVVGPETDLVGKVRIGDLHTRGGRIHYRVRFDRSPWVVGSFRAAPVAPADVTFAWSGDVNGQGWGIDPAHGGMPAFTALAETAPDLFLHCGDAIYADNPIPPSLPLAGGAAWNNLPLEPRKVHVAETLDDYRAAHRYGRRSAEVQAASATIPTFHVWDDHDVRNNWFPSEVLADPAYHEQRIDVLAVAARRAFHEYTPTLRRPDEKMYRVVHWGPLVDFFFLDGRSYRTPNAPVPVDAAFFGKLQTAWLLEELAASKAVWKVVVADMPLGIVCSDLGRDGKLENDAVGNGASRPESRGAPVEREVEIASLLAGMKARGVKNAVWVTAELHYCAAHRYDPARAVFKDFDPFWELVAGPLHATMFPQKPVDETFGPEVTWANVDWDRTGGPSDRSTQTFGHVRIDARTHTFDVRWIDASGSVLHRLKIDPV